MTPTLKKVDGQSRFACLAEALDAAASGETGYSFYDARGELEHVLSYRVLRQDAVRLAKKLDDQDAMASRALALRNLYPESAEFQAYERAVQSGEL